MCVAGEACTTGDMCQTTCTTGMNPMQRFCTCATLPNNSMQFACVNTPCVRDAGTTDGPATVALCPAGVRQGGVSCNANLDTLCESTCVNMVRAFCICTDPAGGGTNPQWVCADQTMACQP
jgi:hypothetical protein